MPADDSYEKDLISKGYNNIVGIDESGMGCFAGDVFVGAVVFPHDIDYKSLLPKLDDSKKLSAEKREGLIEKIKLHSVSWSVASASVEEIDNLNIYWARFLAVKRAIEKLSVSPDYVLIDGNHEIPDFDLPQLALVKGDSRSISIAAASVLAKVHRDSHIESLAKKVHEDYGWLKNKSYYSPSHVDAIKKYGKTDYHRDKYVRKYLK